MSDLVIETVQRRFQSGNSVSVDSVRITAEEWKSIESQLSVAIGREQILSAHVYRLQQEVPKTIRQYRHNNDNSSSLSDPKDGFVFAYCKKSVDKMLYALPVENREAITLVKQAEAVERLVVEKRQAAQDGGYPWLIRVDDAQAMALDLRQKAAAMADL